MPRCSQQLSMSVYAAFSAAFFLACPAALPRSCELSTWNSSQWNGAPSENSERKNALRDRMKSQLAPVSCV